MEAVTFFHLQIIKDPLHLDFHNTTKDVILSRWSSITYFEFDNYSGDEVFTLARKLSKKSKNIVVFTESNLPNADGKISAWLNFILRLESNKLFLWKGKNHLVELMKNAFPKRREIMHLNDLVTAIELEFYK